MTYPNQGFAEGVCAAPHANLRKDPVFTWSHDVHTDDCMSDWSEARRDSMTRATVMMNHRLHMADVERAEDPTDGVTE